MSAAPQNSKKGNRAGKRKISSSKFFSTTPVTFSDYALRTVFLTAQILLLLPLVALATLASQLALHPLYGSTATSTHFYYVIVGTCVLSTLRPSLPAHQSLFYLSILLSAAPYTAKWFGSYTARWRDPVWGPVITQLGLAIPIIGLASVLLRNRLKRMIPAISEVILSPVASLFIHQSIWWIEHRLWNKMEYAETFNSCNIFLALGVLSATLSALSSEVRGATPSAASRALFTTGLTLSIPLILAVFVKSQPPCGHPTLPHTYGVGNITVKLLARQDSITGTVVVAENTVDGYRYLRVDHSLLGGVWTGEKALGRPVGDSIYTAFVLQDAIRLINRPQREEVTEEALIIGLGTGIAAQHMIKHQIKTTVVEIDHAVFEYARRFFNLAEPHAVWIADAREWVNQEAHTSLRPRLGPKFSFVIHDCFSGGGVPTHLFTTEFWTDLKTIMATEEEGGSAIAVNFAGHLGSEAARAIWFTLKANFPGGCRVFHDLITQNEPYKRPEYNEFLNMVYFCRPDGNGVRFRQANKGDWGESYLRKFVMEGFELRELSEQEITGIPVPRGSMLNGEAWVLTDEMNPLGGWQLETAVEHWSVMREVMPDGMWEVY